MPTIADLTTVEGMNKLQAEHKDILQAWKAFNNARGMSSARLLTKASPAANQKGSVESTIGVFSDLRFHIDITKPSGLRPWARPVYKVPTL